MSTEAILNFVFSVITAAIAITAVIVSVIQINKSNKQALFDRRLKAYLTIKRLQNLCNKNIYFYDIYIKDLKDGPSHSIDQFFKEMTNCAFLEEIQPAISRLDNLAEKRKYLFKVEELRNLCEEIRLIFPEKVAYPLADFIYYYEEMIVGMYKYQQVVKSIGKECKKLGQTFPKDESLENTHRKELIRLIEGTFELSNRIYNNGALEKARKYIRYL